MTVIFFFFLILGSVQPGGGAERERNRGSEAGFPLIAVESHVGLELTNREIMT